MRRPGRKHASLAESYAAWRATDTGAELFTLIERAALDMRAKNKKFGVQLLVERVRWETETSGTHEGFKISNNHVAFIGRELVKRTPELATYLVLKYSVADEAAANATTEDRCAL